tara:strand:- start:1330 stop:1983 length:654 start_codon:yes stop_codon:yes gene_type:complete
MERKVAVVLSGCGYLDGAEVTEAVSSLIALSEEGATVEVFAPKATQKEVDHNSDEETGKERNLFEDVARITRGRVTDLENLKEENFDAMVIPGGFGAAKNLSDFAVKASKGKVLPVLEKAIKDFHAASKPIAVFCIAPAMLSLVLGKEGVALSIGNDEGTAAEIEKTGAEHINCDVDDFVTDREHKVISAPAYMYDAKPHEVYTGIRKAIHELIEMA